jgi:23S rRNA (uracil1939-C5)-methyltransferase
MLTTGKFQASSPESGQQDGADAALARAGLAAALAEEVVALHDMAHGGEAVGRLADGRTVFVGGALPGETARVRITESKPRWARGVVAELLSTSPDRVTPACPHFGPCGGCQWQHVALHRQRDFKRSIVIGQLRHVGRVQEELFALVEPTRSVGEADGFGYRNRVSFAVDSQGRSCYHGASSHTLVPIDDCPLLHPLLREWHRAIGTLPGATQLELRAGVRTAQRLALLRGELPAARQTELREQGIPLRAAGDGEITEMVHTERYRISSKAFFQVNTAGAEALVQLVEEMLDPGPEDVVLDAYAGVGLFSLPLARKAARVLAVESNPASIRDLRFHAKGRNIHVVGTPVEEAEAQLPSRLDLVVADPPREGIGGRGLEVLAKRKPRRIVLVACDPASLARDVKGLLAAGYALQRVVPVDLFPHTFHVESVALLTRPAKPLP